MRGMSLVASAGPLGLVQLGALVLVLLGAVAWLRRRRLGVGPGPSQTIRLGPQHAVHVVVVSGRRLLVGTGPDGAPSLLGELDGPHAASDAAEPTPTRTPVGGWDLDR